MASRWTLAELTELDVRLRPSAEVEVPADWQIDGEESRSTTILKWLHATRASDTASAKTGLRAATTESWIRAGYLAVSLLAGVGASAALLRYGGERLINVSAYLGILVGGQILMLVALVISSWWFSSRRGIREALFLPAFLRETPNPISLPAWRWRLFTTFQWGGVLFNLGVLSATLWKVLTFDLAFGWATTLQVETETIHSLVQALSLPWGGWAAPTATQIQNSRIVLLEGFSSVDPASTAAWWPFLLLCVTAYGLLPRFMLAVFGMIRTQNILKGFRFSSPEIEHLYQRLTRGTLRYQSAQTSADLPRRTGSDLPALTPSRPMILEIPSDLESLVDREVLTADITRTLDIDITDNPDQAGICFLIEAWQPPLEETLRTFRTRREQAGPQAEFIILAVGLPQEDGTFAPPSPQHLAAWKDKVSTLRDPNLGLLAWEGAA